MQNNPPVNVPEIHRLVSEKHIAFISDYGPEIEKAVADKRLLTDIIYSRLYRILLCFQEIGVIDDIKTSDKYPKEITLSKKGFDNYVHVLTNGHMIRFEGYAYNLNDFASDIAYPAKTYRNVDEEGYDWTNFSVELLDYIHGSIYDRKSAVNVKMSGIFKD